MNALIGAMNEAVNETMNEAVNLRPQATRHAALACVANIRPDDYARSRNFINGAVTGLSPYLTHGVLTLEEVLHALLARTALTPGHKLIMEFAWRAFFRHVWAHQGDGIFQSLHIGPLPDQVYAMHLPEDISQARTGIPVIDQAVRELTRSGTLHNHARMWLASYIVHHRKVHWRVGADWMVGHLLDGDLASNHLSWQWIAGTGSHQPYLFNAENVARFAPTQWHSPGTVIDCSYEELGRIARALPTSSPDLRARTDWRGDAIDEVRLLTQPPTDLQLGAPDAKALTALQGRQVWLVHPWALRQPPADFDGVVIGVYISEHHQAWPWSAMRWRWVDAAMAEIAHQCWFLDQATLAQALAGAAQVRSVDDPHIRRWLAPLAQLGPEALVFPQFAQPYASFSAWWKQVTRSVRTIEDLLPV